MNMEISMQSLKHVFSFPFHDPKWKDKFLTGSLLAFGGLIVPVVSWLPLLGYAARLVRAGAHNADPAVLPEWDEWSELFMDGLRLLGTSIILMIPSIAVFGFGWLIYMVSMIGLPSSGRYEPSPQAITGFLIGLLVFFLSLGMGTLLALLSSLIATPAEAHVAYQRRFGALFEVGAWWKIFRANLGGFLLTMFVMFSLTLAMTFAAQIMYMTIILCLFIPLAYAPLYFYTLVIFGRLAGQAYGEALEKDQPVPDRASLSQGAA